MTEPIETMRESIRQAIEAFLARSGGGFISGFVYAADVVDHDGQKVKYLGGPLEQDTGTSLGLTSYLDKWYDEEARGLIAQSNEGCGCGQCDSEDD